MPLYYNGAQVKKLYYNGIEVKTGYYNGVKVFSSGPAWYDTLKSMSVGGTVTIDGYEWILVHKTTTAATLGLRYWYMDTQFGTSTAYAGSTIANLAATFESNTLSATTKAYLNNVTVNGVTAKVFIPSKEQFYSGFSYYNSDANRIFKSSIGGYYYTWTSTAGIYGGVWRVNTDGSLDNDVSSYNIRGFRPHMEVNLTL